MKSEGWRRLGQALREGDLRGAAILAGRGVVVARLERMLVLASRPLEAAPGTEVPRGSSAGLTTREAVDTDLAEIARRFPHNATRYADRMRRGEECLLVLMGDAVIGMAWLGFDPDAPRELGCSIHLPDASCWEYDVFVLPGHRKIGAFVFLMDGIFRRVVARGVRRVYAAVSHLNGVSLAAHARIGYTTAAVIDRYELAGFPFWRLTDAAGKTAWRRARDGRGPTLTPGVERN